MTRIKIEDLLERDSRHGLVGLKNLGNTCFMNTAIQCLSHCEDLTKYFLTKKVFDEINRNNKDGTSGQVAKAYYELITELWQGDNKYLCPSDFRQIFVRFVRQFSGFSQHDSNEMLTFMLDTLNEDLNRVKEKPYIEMKEKLVGESDIDASQRWWKNHLSRENSIIVDLFYGQYKSIITCPECSRISITYDPFMCLGLPIPSGHFKIKFKYFTHPITDQVKPSNCFYEYEMPINENTSVKEMKKRVISANKNNVEYENLEGICFSKEKALKKIMRDDEVIYPLFDNGYEISIYERYPSTFQDEIDILRTFYLFPVEFIQERSYVFMSKVSSKLLSYPELISIKNNQTIRDLYLIVFKHYRKIIPDIDISTTYSRFLQNYNNDNYIQSEFKKYFSTSQDKFPFRLHIFNNLPDSSSFFGSKTNCEYCNSKCEHCPIVNDQFTFDDNIDTLFDKQRIARPFLLYVEFSKYFKNSRIFENMEMPLAPHTKNFISKQDDINIYDCINLFRTEERLEKENAWYCSGCKKHQEALKKMELYKVPNYLIVQFKRFKIKTAHVVMGMISNRKNDVFINYPVEGLNLSEYIVGEDKNDAIYDLVGISQHFGSLNSGHYTALCRNFNNWYEFEDSSVSKISNSDIVNESAYMLFYKKRNLGK